MNAIITAEERRLIDAAIAAGKVQKIATGVSTETTYIWNGRDLEAKDGMDLSWRKQRHNAYQQRLSRKAPRDEVIRLVQAGWTETRIMGRLGCSKHWIRRCKSEVDAVRPMGTRQIEAAKRRAKILEVVSSDPAMKVKDISRIVRDAGFKCCQGTMDREITAARKQVRKEVSA